METFYFTLGVLSIVAIIFIVALIWGLVKVVRTKKDLEDFRISYERNLDSNQIRLDEIKREFETTVENLYRRIDELHQESKSHTDKRADQLRQILTESKS